MGGEADKQPSNRCESVSGGEMIAGIRRICYDRAEGSTHWNGWKILRFGGVNNGKMRVIDYCRPYHHYFGCYELLITNVSKPQET